MKQSTLYPLRFDPIFQYRLWGGRGFEEFMSTPLPSEGPYGEAWILSDRDDFSSKVAEGHPKGRSLTQLSTSGNGTKTSFGHTDYATTRAKLADFGFRDET
jgi:mannose-6-phosphate isomerase class I